MQNQPRRLLVCYAHPDDESFGLGAFLARCSADRIEATLICATNGDAGTVAPDKLQGYDSIPSLRLAELGCAAQVLDLHEVVTFGYRDSGMMQNTEKDNPTCLWQAPLEEVTERVAEVMRRVQPQVVITFDPFGGYGHPDHIKIHLATLAALELLRDEPSHPQKLYYSAFPRLMLQMAVVFMRLRGQDPRHLGTNRDLDFQAVLDATLPVHAKIDVSAYYEVGQRAAQCHASQISPRNMFPGGDRLMKLMSRQQRFTRVEPAPLPSQPVERDLFAGITM